MCAATKLHPVFGPKAFHRGADASALVFDTEALGLLPDGVTPGELVGDRRALGALLRRAIGEFRAFAGHDGTGVTPLSCVMYRHVRWMAKALYPTWVASRAAGRLVAPSGGALPVTHLFDGRPAELADSTLLAAVLGATGARVQTRSVLPLEEGAGRDRGAELPKTRSVLFVAGPVEVGFLAVCAAGWDRGGDGSRAVLVTKGEGSGDVGVARVRESELLGRVSAGLEMAGAGVEELEAIGGETTGRCLWRNPGLRAHRDFLCGAYARAMGQRVSEWRRVLSSGRIAGVVAAYPCPALDVAAELGVAAVLLPHGPMVTAEDGLYDTVPAGVRMGAIGEAHLGRLVARGAARGAVRLTGLPSAAGVTGPSALETARLRDVLLLTAEPCRPRDAGSLPRVDPRREIAQLAAVGEAARRRGWRLRLRRHPRYDRSVAFYQQVLGGGVVMTADDARPPLGEEVRSARVVVTVSGPSSAILEASRFGVPVVVGTGSWDFASPDAWGVAAWPIAADSEALERMLTDAVEDDGCAARLAEQTLRAVRAFDGKRDDSATEITRLISEAVAAGACGKTDDA